MDRPASSSICSLAKILWYDRRGATSCTAIVFEQAGQSVKVSTTSPLPSFGRVRLTMGGLECIDERLPRSGAMRLAPLDPSQGEQVAVQASNYSRGGLQVVTAKGLPQWRPMTTLGRV